MIAPERIAQELMPESERAQRRAAAARAREHGDDGGAYWRDLPQLNTVGYHTTMVGAMVACCAIGWVTSRFDPPFARLR